MSREPVRVERARGSRATRPSIMSLGATMSAPARACDTASRASSSSVASLSTSPFAKHAAVAVLGVLAQADVGDDDELRQLALERAHRLLHRPLVVPRLDPSRPCGRECRTAARRRPRASAASRASRSSSSTDVWSTPGIDSTGCRTPVPERTNSGSTSCDGIEPASRARGGAAPRCGADGAGGSRETRACVGKLSRRPPQTSDGVVYSGCGDGRWFAARSPSRISVAPRRAAGSRGAPRSAPARRRRARSSPRTTRRAAARRRSSRAARAARRRASRARRSAPGSRPRARRETRARRARVASSVRRSARGERAHRASSSSRESGPRSRPAPRRGATAGASR